MKLYTKFNKPRKITPINPQSGQPDYNKAVTLFPNEAVEVADELAERLLKQDPHLVSTVPYDKLSPTDRWGKQPAGIPEDFSDGKSDYPPVLPPDKVTDGSLKKQSKPRPKVTDETDIPDELPQDTVDELATQEAELAEHSRKMDILQEIAKKGGIETLTGAQVNHYAKELGVSIARNKKLPERRELLDEACQKIWEAAEEKAATITGG